MSDDLKSYDREIYGERFRVAISQALEAARSDDRGIDWPTYPEAYARIVEAILDNLGIDYEIPEEYREAFSDADGAVVGKITGLERE